MLALLLPFKKLSNERPYKFSGIFTETRSAKHDRIIEKLDP